MFGALLLTTMLAGSAAGEQAARLPTQAEAEALAQQGDREAALAAFQRRVAENPRDITARLWIARLHAQMGRPDLAEPVYRSVMLEAPDNVEAMIGVGSTLVGMQRGDEALLILDRAAKREPKNADVLAALGAAHLQAYNIKLGLSYLESAVSIAPTPAHRLALEDARREHGHHAYASAFFEDFNQDVPNTSNANLTIDYRVADRLRVMARGQYQDKFDFSDQRGGLGLDWQWHPQFTLHVHGLAGPGNDVLPQADALIYVAQKALRAGWDVGYRYVEFDGANVSVFSPGVKWFADRTRVSLRYALAITNYDGVADADDGHTGSLDGAYRIQPRLWLNLGYVYGVDDFDTLSVDRIGRFRAHTARGGFRIDLQTLTSLIGRYDYQWRKGDLTMQRIWVGLSQSF
jgi:YaiO family outer membrane protein